MDAALESDPVWIKSFSNKKKTATNADPGTRQDQSTNFIRSKTIVDVNIKLFVQSANKAPAVVFCV